MTLIPIEPDSRREAAVVVGLFWAAVVAGIVLLVRWVL